MTERKAQVLGLARALFNRDGFGTTSFRAIAAGLKMSPGHLHYHFKTKEALLTALFEAIVLETEGRFGPGIDFRALPAEWLRLQRSYAFFFRELPAILADYPAVRRRYRAIGRKRIEELTVLITALSASGIVIVEPEPGFFRRWAELLWHHCNSALMAVSDGDPESMLEVLILPMLTETGRGFRAEQRKFKSGRGAAKLTQHGDNNNSVHSGSSRYQVTLAPVSPAGRPDEHPTPGPATPPIEGIGRAGRRAPKGSWKTRVRLRLQPEETSSSFRRKPSC